MKGRYEDQKKARELRSLGYTVKEICAELQAGKGSVSEWVRDVEISPESLERYKRKKEEYKNSKPLEMGIVAWSAQCAAKREVWREEGRQAAKHNNDITHALACSLYWAEGAKSGQFCFTNSDAGTMAVMVEFLRNQFSVTDADFVGSVAFYENGGLTAEKVEGYWSKVIGCPSIKWNKHTINPYNKNKVSPEDQKHHVNKLPFGVLRLYVKSSTRIVEHIFGAIEVYSKGYSVIQSKKRRVQT